MHGILSSILGVHKILDMISNRVLMSGLLYNYSKAFNLGNIRLFLESETGIPFGFLV